MDLYTKTLWKTAYRSRYEQLTPEQVRSMPFAPVQPDHFDSLLDSVNIAEIDSNTVVVGKGTKPLVTIEKEGEGFEMKGVSKILERGSRDGSIFDTPTAERHSDQSD